MVTGHIGGGSPGKNAANLSAVNKYIKLTEEASKADQKEHRRRGKRLRLQMGGQPKSQNFSKEIKHCAKNLVHRCNAKGLTNLEIKRIQIQ